MPSLGLRQRLDIRKNSSGLMAAASVAAPFFPLVRGVFLARLLTPEQFGASITGTITMSIAETISDIGLYQMAVKCDSPDEIDTLHTLALIRGSILFLVLALCGPMLAWLFNSPESFLIYSAVGLVILIKSFANLQIKLLTRNYYYVPEAILSLTSQTSWTIATIVAAFVLRNYWAMIVGLFGYALAFVLVSHIYADRPWKLKWNKAVVLQAVAFGRPLVFNGITYAVLSLGDRFLTGAKISLVALAHYTALTTSAFMPRTALATFLNALFLPHFVNATPGEDLRRTSDIWFVVISLLAGLFGFTYLATGQVITTAIFGRAYEPHPSLVSMVAVLGTIRYVTILPTPPALAFSKGKLLLQFTMLSTGGLALGAMLIYLHRSLELLVLGMSIGEVCALAWLVVQLRKLLPVTGSVAVLATATPLVLTSGAAAYLYFIGPSSLAGQALFCLAGAALHLGCCFAMMKVAGLDVQDLFGAMLPSARSRKDGTPSLDCACDDAVAESR